VKQQAIEEHWDDGQSGLPNLHSIQPFAMRNTSLKRGHSQQCEMNCLAVGGVFIFLQGHRMLDRWYWVVEIAFVASFQQNGNAICTANYMEVTGERSEHLVTSTCSTRGPRSDQHPPSLRPAKEKEKDGFPMKILGMEQRGERGSQKMSEGTNPWVQRRRCLPALHKCEMFSRLQKKEEEKSAEI
jgi:hypothetical protein